MRLEPCGEARGNALDSVTRMCAVTFVREHADGATQTVECSSSHPGLSAEPRELLITGNDPKASRELWDRMLY